MANFFEKLKKGMGIEETIEETVEETVEEKKIVTPKKTRIRKPKKLEIQTIAIQEEPKGEKEIEKEEVKEEKIEEEIKKPELEEKKKPFLAGRGTSEDKEKWASFNQDSVGQLAIDVYQTENDLVIQSAIAGVKPENLDIVMEKDIIMIKGIREKPFEETGDYFSQECYWGSFSREVILPAEVDPNRAMAEMKDGILTIRIPKILKEKKRRIVVRES